MGRCQHFPGLGKLRVQFNRPLEQPDALVQVLASDE